MKTVLLILVSSLAGCAASAKPNFYDGNYYMGGDESCKRFRPLNGNRIMCLDKTGTETGYRDAMTDQQLQMYRHDQQMSQIADQSLQQRLDNLPDYTKSDYWKVK